MSQSTRSAVLDCTKGVACLAIVLHHLAFYGPMSEVAHPAMPDVMDWLFEYARMAVQVFLVLGGYLAAASLAPLGKGRAGSPWPRMGKRFVRLLVPYAVALVITIVVSAAIRPWFDHESVSADPDLWQLIAHALLLQNIVGEESLSAGVWYVSIDFQLFTLTTLLLAGTLGVAAWVRQRHGVQALARWWPWGFTAAQALVVVGVAASLLYFNLDAEWDIWALYFFGAYGLGMLAYWAAHASDRAAAWGWSLLIAALVVAALALHWRDRIALAGVTALLLVCAMRSARLSQWQGWAPLSHLGKISYSVFLVHFSVVILSNAVVNHFWPDSIPAALLGMAGAVALSLLAGQCLYQKVERHVPTWNVALRWQAGLIGTGLLTALLAGLR